MQNFSTKNLFFKYLKVQQDHLLIIFVSANFALEKYCTNYFLYNDEVVGDVNLFHHCGLLFIALPAIC